MKTEHLDDKINELETLRSRGELTYMGGEMLSEFNEIKQVLLMQRVNQQRELLEGFVDWFNKTDKTQAIINERVDEYIETL